MPWPGVDEVELRAIGTRRALCRRAPKRRTRSPVRSPLARRRSRSIPPRTRASRFATTCTRLVRSRSGSHTATRRSCSSFGARLRRGVSRRRCRRPLQRRRPLLGAAGEVRGTEGRVSAVESSPHAVHDARENATGLRQLKVREWSVSPRSVNDTVRRRSSSCSTRRVTVLRRASSTRSRDVPRVESSTCRVTPRRSRATLKISYGAGLS